MGHHRDQEGGEGEGVGQLHQGVVVGVPLPPRRHRHRHLSDDSAAAKREERSYSRVHVNEKSSTPHTSRLDQSTKTQ